MRHSALLMVFALLFAGRLAGQELVAPVFVQEPSDQVVEVGGWAYFWSSTTAATPLAYQWRFNGEDLPGENGTYFSKQITSTNMAGYYQVVASSDGGAVTSRVAILTVTLYPPQITRQPTNETVNEGESVTLSVGVTGTAPITYQWRVNDQVIPNAVSSSLHLPAVSGGQAGRYQVEVSNLAGRATSEVAVVTVLTDAPRITRHPWDQAVAAGIGAASFIVEATGARPFYFQWRFNGKDIPGAIHSYYERYSPATNDVGHYEVVVGNLYGAVTSAVARLSVVVQPPSMIRQPESCTADAGSDVSFSSDASGSPPLTFQWQRDGENLAGQNSQWLPFNSVTTNQAGNYRVIVSNAAGMVTSAVARLTVVARPAVITQFSGSREVDAGYWFDFSARADGSPPISYQWQLNGQDIVGANLSYLYRYGITTNDAGDYRVVVSNAYGSATSRVATLTVRVHPPLIYRQPESRGVDSGAWVSLDVGVSGTSPLFFQWQKDGINMAGATNDRVVFGEVSLDQQGAYQVVVTNAYGAVTSSVATLAVNHRSPEIVRHPEGGTVSEWGSFILSVEATGSLPLTYQWRRNGQEIAGQTQSAYGDYSAGTGDGGAYDVVVRNGFGSVTSLVAQISVQGESPWITSHPQGVSAEWGSDAQFWVQASGSQPLAFQWQKDGVDLPGENDWNLVLTALTTNDAGLYWVIVSNPYGMVTSTVAAVVVSVNAPYIVEQPGPQIVSAGETARFSVSASGALPLHYQWLFNGQVIPGANDPSLDLSTSWTNEAGEYRVVVSNWVGVVTSDVARLMVRVFPAAIVGRMVDRTVDWGENVCFSPGISGSSPITMQWMRNGEHLPGATDLSLCLEDVTTQHAGSYQLVATNPLGASTSGVAQLTVVVRPPLITRQPVGQAVDAGDYLSFCAEAVGALPLYYQWQFDGQDIPGATNSYLWHQTLWTNDAGAYRVVVSNWVGVVTSEVARVTVRTYLPMIVEQPQSQIADLGGEVWLGVSASGSPVLTYQWQRGGLTIAGATNSSLHIWAATWADASSYQVVVSNPLGAVTSAVATLTVEIRPPHITDQPFDRGVDVGDWYEFSVAAEGARPLFYQWQLNGVNIPGGTSERLGAYAQWTNDLGAYRVVISNLGGSVTSAVARLHVEVHPPSITGQTDDQTVDWGSSVGFEAAVAGSPPLSYKWQRNGRAIAGANERYLFLPSVTTNHAGDYRLVASNPWGKAISAAARLTVLVRGPRIVTQPEGATVDAGEGWYTRVEAVGARPLSYQWQLNGQNIEGAVSEYCYATPISARHAGDYQVVVSNFLGVVTSAVARLTVVERAPEIVQSPMDRVVDIGWWFSFDAWGRGAPPLHLQWQRDGVDIANATNFYFEANFATTNDAGQYRLVASNALGVVTSAVATLTVRLYAPSITRQPTDVVVDAGSQAYIDVAATGSPWPTFQWQHGGRNLPQATNGLISFPPFAAGTHLTLPSATSNDAGSYRVIISNSVGTVTSDVATVTVRYRPLEFNAQPENRKVRAGDWASFSVSVAGGPVSELQWYHNGVPLGGKTGGYLQFRAFSTNQGGAYMVTASNVFGVVTSGVAILTVEVAPPDFTSHPVSHGIAAGGSVEFRASASKDPTLSFQWQHDGADIPYATNQGYTIERAAAQDTGSYRVVICNEAGEAVSQAATLTVAARGPLDDWRWRHPLPQGNNLRSLAQGQGVLLAVGEHGARIRSEDGGRTWKDCSSDDVDLDLVIFGNGMFVGFQTGWYPTEERIILSSPDGIAWSRRSLHAQEYEAIRGAAFGNGRFVAVTSRGGSWVSTNGLDWSQYTEQYQRGYGFSGLGFSKGLFVANVDGHSMQGWEGIATSQDGVNWAVQTLKDIDGINGPVVNDSRMLFYAVERYGGFIQVLTSDNGSEWTIHDLNPPFYASHILCGAGRFFGFWSDYAPTFYSSRDGVNWTQQPTVFSNKVSALHFDGIHFVTVGDQGGIHTSTNGESWVANNPGKYQELTCVAYGNNRYVAVGDGGLVRTSTDGHTWTRQHLPTPANLRGVAFGHGRFVAVGSSVEGSEAVILLSEDGETWIRCAGEAFSALWGITFGNERFMAVGEDGVLATSADGLTWTAQYSANGERLNAVTYGAGKFVAVGEHRSVVTSTGEGEWVTRDSFFGPSLRGVDWGNGLFVAGGASGVVLVSLDGENWVEVPAFTWPSGSPDIEDVQFFNGTFMAAGSEGFLATSTDAALWIEHRTGCQYSLRSAVHAGGYVTVVGDSEAILQSDYFGSPRLKVRAMRPGEGFELSADGEPGQSCRLQASEDMVHWENLLEFTNTQTAPLFLDPVGRTAPHRFYRLVTP